MNCIVVLPCVTGYDVSKRCDRKCRWIPQRVHFCPFLFNFFHFSFNRSASTACRSRLFVVDFNWLVVTGTVELWKALYQQTNFAFSSFNKHHANANANDLCRATSTPSKTTYCSRTPSPTPTATQTAARLFTTTIWTQRSLACSATATGGRATP